MSSENIKKVYVLNLDKKRIIILSGILFIFFGLSFLAGLKWEHEPVLNAPDLSSNAMANNADDHPIISMNSPLTEKNALALPEEDNRIFTKNAESEEDPFLIDPPVRSAVKENKTAKIREKTPPRFVDKTSEKAIERKKNSLFLDKKSKTEEKFYTIQLAAFPHEKDAVAYKKDMTKKGLDARVDHGKLYYFVRVGKSTNRSELETLYKKIHDTMKIQSVLVQRKIS